MPFLPIKHRGSFFKCKFVTRRNTKKARRTSKKLQTKVTTMEFDRLSREIIGSAIEVHKALGPGLLESTYEECLTYELRNKGLMVVKQKPVPVIYKNIYLECGYRLDILVNNEIIVEIKSVDALIPVHEAQILTYMKLSNINIGLLINFNVTILKNGLKRYVM